MVSSILRSARAASRSATASAWRLLGKRYSREAGSSGSGAAVAILVDRPWGYQLDELVARFANDSRVTFVSWGPFALPTTLTSQGSWLHSKANSWGSAANFALNGFGFEKVLLLGQEFDVLPEELDALLALPVGASPVVLDANGLVVSAGLARSTSGGPFEHVLRDFNVADLPSGLNSGLPGVGAVIAGADSAFDVMADDASALGVGSIAFDVRIRYFKNYALPRRSVSVAAGDFKGELLGPKLGQPRWAIKNPAWGNRRGDNWGDTFFVNDLADALRAQGIHVADDRLQNWYRPTRKFEDVELVIRGKSAYKPSGKAKSILWVISNPESVSVEEVRSFDLVFAASASWARDMSARSGKPVQVLLQATNPERFKWQPADKSLASEVLFVGKTRGVFREVVDFAVRAKAPLSVYGEGWHDYIDAGFIKSEFLANQKVPAAYASCSILLNDHWQDMRDLGFASNRLFDAAACGARVLSDHIDGLDELFGGLVKTYKNYEEFFRLVNSPSAWPSDSERKRLASVVAKEHSFEARAKALIAASL